MNYIVKLMDGSKHPITEEEFQKLAGKTGLVFIPSLGETINLLSVSGIYPENREDFYFSRTIDRNRQFEGMLASGERVVKHYGQWFLADGPKDDDGLPFVQPDPQRYTELKHGILPTPEEYQTKYQFIESSQWPQLLASSNSEMPQHNLDKRIGGGFSALIETKKEPD